MSNIPVITSENLLDVEYTPRVGTQYEIAPDCVRSMLKPTYGRDKRYSEMMAREDVACIDPEDPSYSASVRIRVVEMVTDGDPIPEEWEEIDMEVVGRIVADFFTFRIAKPARQPSLLRSTNEIQQ